jgi:hypothetical protein
MLTAGSRARLLRRVRVGLIDASGKAESCRTSSATSNCRSSVGSSCQDTTAPGRERWNSARHVASVRARAPPASDGACPIPRRPSRDISMQRGTASPWFGASPDLNRFGPTLLSAATTPIISGTTVAVVAHADVHGRHAALSALRKPESPELFSTPHARTKSECALCGNTSIRFGSWPTCQPISTGMTASCARVKREPKP